MIRKIEMGMSVVYVDETRVEHDALITQTWGAKEFDDEKPLVHPDNWAPSINLVYVAKDDRKDQYGNQTIHKSSVAFLTFNAAAGGNLWKFKA